MKTSVSSSKRLSRVICARLLNQGWTVSLTAGQTTDTDVSEIPCRPRVETGDQDEQADEEAVRWTHSTTSDLLKSRIDEQSFSEYSLSQLSECPITLPPSITQLKKGTCRSMTELELFCEEVYKATTEKLRLGSSLKGIKKWSYLPETFWSLRDEGNARAMNQAIDKRLKTRRIMRSLEKFVGGRPYGAIRRLGLGFRPPMIQPEPEGSTQGYPLVSVEVLRSLESYQYFSWESCQKILLKLNLLITFILTDSKVKDDLNDPKDSSKTDKAAQNGRTPKSLTLEIHHGGWFTPTPSRSYIGGQVSSVNVVDIDEFCLHDLKDMVVKLGYGVEDLICQITKSDTKRIGSISDHVDYIETTCWQRQEKVDVSVLKRSSSIKNARKSNSSFTTDPKHDTSIDFVDVQEDDLDVIDYDSFGSDLDGGIDSERRIQLRGI
ncbi:hypothetical protein Tco_0223146 [Tanacetum coccineum]